MTEITLGGAPWVFLHHLKVALNLNQSILVTEQLSKEEKYTVPFVSKEKRFSDIDTECVLMFG